MSKKSIIALITLLVAALLLVGGIVLLVNGNDNSAAENTDEASSVEKGEDGQKHQTVGADPESGASATNSGNRPTANTTSNAVVSTAAPATELSPIVSIIPEKDNTTGEPVGIKFPCEIEGYGLVIEKLEHYNGTFVEDGTNVNLDSVAMLLIVNNGKSPLEYAQISIQYGQESLLFDITALPVGEKLVVQEKSGKSIPEGEPTSATAMVLQESTMELSADSISIVDNGDNTLTVKNLTNKTIPAIRVFYKYYMPDENIFVGGISFTIKLTRIGAGESITVQPSHYSSKTSKVVMVLTYESEV